MKRIPAVLVVAGSDPSGGGGLELDLQVLGRLGVPGAGVATCLTLQTSRGLQELRSLPVAEGLRRAAAVVADLDVRAIKVGLLPGAAWIRELGRWLQDVEATVIVDPVLAPSRGPAFHGPAGPAAYRRWLIPRADLLTPNAGEAALLLDRDLRTVRGDPEQAAAALLELGTQAVLLKGGHLDPRGREVVDRLRGAWGEKDFPGRRHPGPPPRGTGCALSTAIAALGTHQTPRAAVGSAIRFVRAAIAGARQVGRGRPHLGLP